MTWENISQENNGNHYRRTPIFGGWLVECTQDVVTTQEVYYGSGSANFRNEVGFEWRSSVTFVPDIKHEWELLKKGE